MSGNLEEIIEEQIIEEIAESNKTEDLIPKDEFQRKSSAQKLDSVADAINKMYKKMQQVTDKFEEKLKPVQDAVFDEEEGILPQVQTMIEHVKEADSNIESIKQENLQLRDEVDILKGIVHKLSSQVEVANSKIDNLFAKTMEGNLIITGILQDKIKANTRRQVHQFLYQQLEVPNVHDEDLLDVYRIGHPEPGKSRSIVIQCTQELKNYILRNTGKLHNKLNEEGGKFYINPQLPEALAENRREIRQNIKERKNQEKAIPKENKSTFMVRANKLYINGQLKQKKLTTPTVMQLFPAEDEQKKINSIKLKYMRAKPEAGSKFKAALFTPRSIEEVRFAYLKLFQDYPSADHIAAAFSVNGEQDYQDNNEYGSGYRLLKIIRELAMDNIAIFIVRFHGGINLGPRRFALMMDLARAALLKLQDSIERQSHSSHSRPSYPSTSDHSSDKDDDAPSTVQPDDENTQEVQRT